MLVELVVDYEGPVIGGAGEVALLLIGRDRLRSAEHACRRKGRLIQIVIGGREAPSGGELVSHARPWNLQLASAPVEVKGRGLAYAFDCGEKTDEVAANGRLADKFLVAGLGRIEIVDFLVPGK